MGGLGDAHREEKIKDIVQNNKREKQYRRLPPESTKALVIKLTQIHDSGGAKNFLKLSRVLFIIKNIKPINTQYTYKYLVWFIFYFF